MLNKNLSKAIVYLSIIFLVIYLYKNGYVVRLEINDYFLFFISLLFLILGFIFQSLAWHSTINSHDINITKSVAFVSEFIAIFAKYIPGKVMMILGPASYVSANSNISLKDASFYSFQVQILNLWLGLLIGSLVLIYIDLDKEWIYLLITCELLLTIFLFSQFFHSLFLKIINHILNKNISFPIFSHKLIKNIIPFIFFRWIFWVLAFSFFISSISEVAINLTFGLGFVLAGVLGVLALFSPGGIGVREGILVLILSLLGLSIELSTTISIASRVWFIIGEIIVFIIGFILSKYVKDEK